MNYLGFNIIIYSLKLLSQEAILKLSCSCLGRISRAMCVYVCMYGGCGCGCVGVGGGGAEFLIT